MECIKCDTEMTHVTQTGIGDYGEEGTLDVHYCPQCGSLREQEEWYKFDKVGDEENVIKISWAHPKTTTDQHDCTQCFNRLMPVKKALDDLGDEVFGYICEDSLREEFKELRKVFNVYWDSFSGKEVK